MFTNINSPDSDFDGYLDGYEVEVGADPLSANSPLPLLEPRADIGFSVLASGAGSLSQDEFLALNGEVLDTTDSDGDGFVDQRELELGTNPRAQDTDQDLLFDSQELLSGLNPLDPDTDGDGVLDGWQQPNTRQSRLFDFSDL